MSYKYINYRDQTYMSVNILKNTPIDILIETIKNSRSKSSVLKKLGSNRRNSTALIYLNDFIKSNEIDISHFSSGVPLSEKYNKDYIQEIVNKSLCWSDVLRHLDIDIKGNNHNTVKNLVKYLNIDVSHFDHRKASRVNKSKNVLSVEDVLVENSKHSRQSLKRLIVENKLLEYKCAECGLSDSWNSKYLVLQIEHKNGKFNDNRLENLCYLCPNCHSQTQTFSKKKNNGPVVN